MSDACDQPIALRIAASSGHLPVVRAAVERLCECVGFDADAAGQIVLGVDEALTNVIRHAYGGPCEKPIEVELTPLLADDARGVRVRIRDWGRSVDPSRIKSRDLDDVRPGGLGVHIINECMDSVDYRPADGGGTVLTMVKTLGKNRQDAKT